LITKCFLLSRQTRGLISLQSMPLGNNSMKKKLRMVNLYPVTNALLLLL